MNIFECEMLARYLCGIGEDVDEVDLDHVLQEKCDLDFPVFAQLCEMLLPMCHVETRLTGKTYRGFANLVGDAPGWLLHQEIHLTNEGGQITKHDTSTAIGRLSQMLDAMKRQGPSQVADDLEQLIRFSEVTEQVSASDKLRRASLVMSLQCRVSEMPKPTEDNYEWWAGELVDCVLQQDARLRSRGSVSEVHYAFSVEEMDTFQPDLFAALVDSGITPNNGEVYEVMRGRCENYSASAFLSPTILGNILGSMDSNSDLEVGESADDWPGTLSQHEEQGLMDHVCSAVDSWAEKLECKPGFYRIVDVADVRVRILDAEKQKFEVIE